MGHRRRLYQACSPFSSAGNLLEDCRVLPIQMEMDTSPFTAADATNFFVLSNYPGDDDKLSRRFLNPCGHLLFYLSSRSTHHLTNSSLSIKHYSLILQSTHHVIKILQSICIWQTSINTWVEILSASIYFHVNIFWRFVLWSLSLVTLPVRALGALQREKQLKEHLSELQDRLDSLACDRKELQEHFQIAIKEHEMMEMVLSELEEEREEAIHKVKLLETELKDLKDENLRLQEVRGKSNWDTDTQVGAGYGYGQKRKDAKASNVKDDISPWKSERYQSGIGLKDILMHTDTFEDDNRGKFDANDFVKTDDVSLMHQIIPGVFTRSVDSDGILGQRKEVALSQSLFSTILSLLVGMIVWQAGDPCMPLITALFMVVGMSLKSAVGFFSIIENKPSSDVVFLLSLNWFILGTLTYPTLPRVVRLLLPFFTKSFPQALGRFLTLLTSYIQSDDVQMTDNVFVF